MSDIIVGIDLGTTNSEIAVVQDGRVRVLEVEGQSKLFPSVVGIDDNSRLLIGTAARNQYALFPERTIKSVKRQMGSDEAIVLGEHPYSAPEVSAMILGRLKSIAEAQLGEPVTRAVITVPAFFSDAQRQATREAGELAGFKVERIINEPTAAALAYESDAAIDKRVLVYDLGGGTFDVSIVHFSEGVVEVLSSHGDNHLGGDDFDQEIVTVCLTHLAEAQCIDPTSNLRAMARIQRAAEAAKIRLSHEPFALIEEEYLLGQGSNKPVNLSLELARSDYEAMIKSYLDRTLEAMHQALAGAALSVRDLDEVLLVGGATRTPAISRLLEEATGLQPRIDVDPDLCVAAGAAIQGAMIRGDERATVLVDVTPYTFGTGALGELDGLPYPYCFVPVIRKNTPIPVSRTEVFYTAFDDQEQIDVGVYQGEDKDALNNTEIGKFMVEGLRKVPMGDPITLSFALDLNGILHVTAREKETGLEKSITITNALVQRAEEDLDAARARIGALLEQPSIDTDETDTIETGAEARSASGKAAGSAQHQRHVTQANALLEKAQRLLGDASADDREDLVDQIEALKDALTSNDEHGLDTATNELSDLVYYLESN